MKYKKFKNWHAKLINNFSQYEAQRLTWKEIAIEVDASWTAVETFVRRHKELFAEQRVMNSAKAFVDAVDEHFDKLDGFEAMVIEKDKKVKKSHPHQGTHLVLGCVHIPFQNQKVLNGIYQLMSDIQFDGLHLIGDFLDLNTLSSHDKGRFTAVPNLTLDDEYEAGNEVLDNLDSLLSDTALKTYLYGNHEDRWNRYMADMQAAKTPLVSPEKALKLTERGYATFTKWNKDFFVLGKHLELLHGEYFNVHTAKKHLDVLRSSCLFAHCFSEDTEVLTENGWKLFPDLDIANDKVASIKLDTHEFEWQNINSFHTYDNYDELIHFNSHGMDLLVTDKHSMLKLFKKSNRLERVEAKELFNKHWETLNGTINIQEDYNIDDNLLKLMGWVITDGHYEKHKGVPKYIRIKQCNKDKVGIEHITNILDNLGQSYKVSELRNSTNYECGDIYLHKSKLTDSIIELCPNKGLQWWMMSLSKRQFDILLHEIILADGCYNKDSINSMQYVTAKDSDKDIMQALCISNGYRSAATFRQNSYWTLTINVRRTSWIADSSSEKVAYKGNVYCVSVDNQSLLVRRNNKTSICGNTHRIQTFVEGNSAAFNIGYLGNRDSATFSYAGRAQKSMWQNGFSTVTIDENGDYFVEQIIVCNDKFVYGSKIYG